MSVVGAMEKDASLSVDANNTLANKTLAKSKTDDVLFLESRRRSQSLYAWEPEDGWSRFRSSLAKVFRSTYFEILLLITIACNFVTAVIETNARARGDKKVAKDLEWINRAFLAIYGLEMLGRIFVQRMTFCHSRINVFDALAVFVDALSELISAAGGESWGSASSASMLRIFRIGRFLRAGHIIVFFPELYWMTRGMASAFKSLLWGVLLIGLVLTMWSIAAVEVIHPMMDDIASTGVWSECPRCHKSFESVFQAFLTFFGQLVAGDSWGKVSDPVIRHSPWQASPILFGALFSVNLGVINLILAVIIDRAQEAHREDIAHIVKVKQAGYESSKDKLLDLVHTMDMDKNGEITLSELVTGYDAHPLFRSTLEAMDIGKEDMGVVFNILDEDNSGSVDYGEFVKQLYRMKANDSHTMLVFIQHYCKELRQNVRQQLRLLGAATANKLDETQEKLLERMMQSLDLQFGRHANDKLSVNRSTMLQQSSQTANMSEQTDNNDVSPATDFWRSAAMDDSAPGSYYAEVAHLREAVSELTVAIHAASHKSAGLGLDMVEPKHLSPRGNTVAPVELLTWTPAPSSQAIRSDGSRQPSGSLAAQLAIPEREDKMQSNECCGIRFPSDALLPVRSV